MLTRAEEEWADDDLIGASRHTTGKRLRDVRRGQFHVRGLNDGEPIAVHANEAVDELVEEAVAFLAARAVIDDDDSK